MDERKEEEEGFPTPREGERVISTSARPHSREKKMKRKGKMFSHFS